MTISAKLTAKFTALQAGANAFGDRFDPIVEAALAVVNGTGAGQADLLYADERTITTGADDDIDLTGGLTDAFGATLTFVELVALLVINAPITGNANTTDLSIGGGGANSFVGFFNAVADIIGPIKPGGAFLLAAADAAGIGTVVDSSGDVLRISNSSGATAIYQIVILGRSA